MSQPKSQPMAQAVVEQLLALNREFYATVAVDFDASRHSVPAGMLRALAAALPLRVLPLRVLPLRVLDVGCGNARLLRALAQAFPTQPAIVYLGVESDAALLAYAQTACAAFARGQAQALPGDILRADLGLPHAGGPTPALFDLVVCFAVLHHIPSTGLRVQALRNLAERLAPGGRLLVSTWQFEQSARLRSRIVPWARIGLTADDVEAGDALLPWDQGVHALRYAHYITPDELHSLAAAARLEIEHTFFDDGHEGNLNLYAVLARKEQHVS